MASKPLSELMQAAKNLSDHLDKPKGLKLELNLQSPYTTDGSPRQDLPTGEVLAWDWKEWCNGFLADTKHGLICLCDDKDLEYIALTNVRLFAPLPTIIEDGNEAL